MCKSSGFILTFEGFKSIISLFGGLPSPPSKLMSYGNKSFLHRNNVASDSPSDSCAILSVKSLTFNPVSMLKQLLSALCHFGIICKYFNEISSLPPMLQEDGNFGNLWKFSRKCGLPHAEF